mmetsp:Transcript_28564/g.68691  ORF Transcript_28564/g.68691 Transcript_28564/m.68691 type:complete len:223 (-) Transcript_28564:2310-2978(-)
MVASAMLSMSGSLLIEKHSFACSAKPICNNLRPCAAHASRLMSVATTAWVSLVTNSPNIFSTPWLAFSQKTTHFLARVIATYNCLVSPHSRALPESQALGSCQFALAAVMKSYKTTVSNSRPLASQTVIRKQWASSSGSLALSACSRTRTTALAPKAGLLAASPPNCVIIGTRSLRSAMITPAPCSSPVAISLGKVSMELGKNLLSLPSTQFASRCTGGEHR